jgi:hypothetical protein
MDKTCQQLPKRMREEMNFCSEPAAKSDGGGPDCPFRWDVTDNEQTEAAFSW